MADGLRRGSARALLRRYGTSRAGLQTVGAGAEVAVFGGAGGAAGGFAAGGRRSPVFAKEFKEVGTGGEQPVVARHCQF